MKSRKEVRQIRGSDYCWWYRFMDFRILLTSLTVWIASAMGVIVGLACVLMGFDEGFGSWLQAGYLESKFTLLSQVHQEGLGALLILGIVSVVVALMITGTRGAGRRIVLLLTSLILVAMASPVLALWGVFWNPFVLWLSVLWVGLAVMIHSIKSDHQR